LSSSAAFVVCALKSLSSLNLGWTNLSGALTLNEGIYDAGRCKEIVIRRNPMKFSRRLFRYCLAGAVIWFLAGMGTGLYLRPFMILFGWPLFLLHPFSSGALPDWFNKYTWSTACLISLTAWVLLSALAAAVAHGIAVLRKHKDVPKV
jgi:hypothetical protein